ncbi:MAG: V-type ATPase 116kDa subunit family protein [Vicinamibacterales bacterium]
MFRAVPMVHVQAQVPSRDGPAVTRRIAAEGLLHLVDIAHGQTTSTSSDTATRDVLARFRDLSRVIRRVAALIDLPLSDAAGSLPTPDVNDFGIEYQALADRVAPLREAADLASRRLSEARDEAARRRVAADHARRLAAAGIDLARLGRLRLAYVRLGYAARNELAALAGLLSPAPFAVVPLDADARRTLAAVVAPVTARDQVDAVLRVSAFEPVTLSPADAAVGADELSQRIDEAAQREREAGEALTALRRDAGDEIDLLSRRADVAVLLLQAQTCFATSGRFLVISGWIPEDRAPELTAAIQRVTGGRAVVAIDKPEDLPASYASTLKVPILYRNPLLLRPFQQLVELYGIPSYGEIQPTAFFAVSFLLMFGLMFGDVGHGLVLVSAGSLLFRYAPRFLDYAILLMEAGVASAVFGVLHGSIFGVETLLPAIWLHPIHDLPRFMAVAVALGVVLVSGGIVLNVINSWQAGERVSALVGTRGVFGAFVYWTTLALAARFFLPGSWMLPDSAIFLLLAGAVGLLVARPVIVRALGVDRASRPPEGATPGWLAALEGAVELVDALFAFFANTISFVRVAAFAAVHAAIFVAMFALADTLARYRFGGPLSVGALVAGNVVMILLEGLTVTVQVLRLEYYEFFGKFFRGGGERYRPLMLRPNGIQGGP